MRAKGKLGTWILVVWLSWGAGGAPAAETLRDLRILPQDARAYVTPEGAEQMRIAAREQDRQDARYNERFFAPWHQTQPRHGVEEIIRAFRRCQNHPGYAENGRRHTTEWLDGLEASARFETYPNARYVGMTTRRTDVRSLPTNKPRYADWNTYPFDLLQETHLPVNTPVFVVHETRDKAWMLVETAWTVGWLPAEDVVPVDETLIRAWESGPYVTVIRNRVPVYGVQGGAFLFEASLGAMFPLAKAREDGWEILVTVPDRGRRGAVLPAFAARAAVERKPLPLTPENVAGLINTLIGEPYGWGGMHGNRDCSATLRDLFAPFGIWLPRNSMEQARQGGGVINLKRLEARAREAQIVSRGVPFLSLLWEPGHIMLYLGRREGEICVFHNFWAVKVRDRKGRVRQKIIVGRAAVTTLRPGREFQKKGLRSPDRLRELWAMTLLPPAL